MESQHQTKILLGETKPVSNRSAWAGFWQKCCHMWPFIWPSGNCRLQLRVIACVLLLIASRAVNVLIPVLQKFIVNSMTQLSDVQTGCERVAIAVAENGATSEGLLEATVVTETSAETVQRAAADSTASVLSSSVTQFRWDAIMMWVVLKTLQGDTGYLNIVRTVLWIGVSIDTRKKMRVKLFMHLHSLSVRWHLHRKTGEVLRVMDRGVNSINVVLNHAVFNLMPIIADVVIAVVFFVTVFNWWMGFIVFTTMILYAVFTVVLSEWRTKFRREMNNANNDQDAASVDSILNFETVKYHAAEDFETQRYAVAVDKLLHCEWLVSTSLSVLNFFQKTTMGIGLLSGSLICASNVYSGQLTVGDYILFISYVEQLYGPLNALGMYYRLMQQAFIDMENMFEMLDQKQEVIDNPGAVSMRVTKGEIRFDQVSFQYYDKKPLLQNVSFSVPPGQTFALVGPSGGGKSTFVRLILRFYDIQSGAIMIDGQDVSMVTQKSLRQQIGVVPQDTVLFNNDIRYNIRYGNQMASDNDIFTAAKSADIHNFICDLPTGYDTLVGERGLRLSGGEKQRIAIARTLLKDPRIVLLDEATSALDTKTERNIQSSLSRMCENRTTIVVAHRLSTVINADQILVIRNGAIVERGRHEELLKLGNIYADMWLEQLRSGLGDTETLEQQRLSQSDRRFLTSGDNLHSDLPIIRSFSLPTSSLLNGADDEELSTQAEEGLPLSNLGNFCEQSSTSGNPNNRPKRNYAQNSRGIRGDQMKNNLKFSLDNTMKGFLSIPVNLQKF